MAILKAIYKDEVIISKGSLPEFLFRVLAWAQAYKIDYKDIVIEESESLNDN